MKIAKTKEKTPKATSRSNLPNQLTLAVGANLQHYRKQAGMTQVDLAYDVELERTRISKMENGLVNPSLLTLATICHCLKITMAQLFEGIKVTHPPTYLGGIPRRANQATLDKPPQKLAKRKTASKAL